MKLEFQAALLMCLATSWSGTALADPTRPGPEPRLVDISLATPLRSIRTLTTNAIAGPGGGAAFQEAQCDQDGSVYFLPYPQSAPTVSPGGVPTRIPLPREIVRVSADARKVTRFDPASSPVFAGTDEIQQTFDMALDAQGTLYALVWSPRSRGDGRLYIVSFKRDGSYASRIEIKPGEMGVHKFEIFGTGEFLLHGNRMDASNVAATSGGRLVPRLAVMAGGGAPLRDVLELPDDLLGAAGGMEQTPDEAERQSTGAETMSGLPANLDYTVRGGDGRIYMVRGGTSSIYAVDSSGHSEKAVTLPRMPSELRLAGMRASGGRLALSYADDKFRTWIAVLDVALGEQVGLYGPAVGSYPLCYDYTGSDDRFTGFRDGDTLVTLAP